MHFAVEWMRLRSVSPRQPREPRRSRRQDGLGPSAAHDHRALPAGRAASGPPAGPGSRTPLGTGLAPAPTALLRPPSEDRPHQGSWVPESLCGTTPAAHRPTVPPPTRRSSTASARPVPQALTDRAATRPPCLPRGGTQHLHAHGPTVRAPVRSAKGDGQRGYGLVRRPLPAGDLVTVGCRCASVLEAQRRAIDLLITP